MLSNNNSNDVRANIKKPTGNAKNIHHIGMLISISMTWPKLKYIIVASRPALKKMQADISATMFTIKNKISLFFFESKGVKKSTLICCPFLSKGPNKGNTSQLTNTGGNSINQANPVPVMKRVAALRNNAATIIKMIDIARANEAEAR